MWQGAVVAKWTKSRAITSVKRMEAGTLQEVHLNISFWLSQLGVYSDTLIWLNISISGQPVLQIEVTSITSVTGEDREHVCSHVYSDRSTDCKGFHLNQNWKIPKVNRQNNVIMRWSSCVCPWLQPSASCWEMGGIMAQPVTQSNYQSGLGPERPPVHGQCRDCFSVGAKVGLDQNGGLRN